MNSPKISFSLNKFKIINKIANTIRSSKTYEYFKKYNPKLSERLIKYLKGNFNLKKQNELQEIQAKHYGHIKFSPKELLHFYKALVNDKNNINSNLFVTLSK